MNPAAQTETFNSEKFRPISEQLSLGQSNTCNARGVQWGDVGFNWDTNVRSLL